MGEKTTGNGHVSLSLEQIPQVKEPMSLMKLGAAALAPDGVVLDIVRSVAPNAEFKEIGKSGAKVAYDGVRVVAFVNPKTGESRVFPLLESLKPGQRLTERAKAISTRIIHNETLFPKDGTQVVPLRPATLLGSRHSRGGDATRPSEYLSFVRLQRRVNGASVFGPGSRAMIAVANDDSIRAFTHRWRKATPTDRKVAPLPRTEVARSIVTQLATSAKNADVKVDKVTIAYYDDGRTFLQPVYRFGCLQSYPKI